MKAIEKLYNEINVLTEDYNKLKLQDTLDYDKHKLYKIVANSTALEGSSLTVTETQLLLENGVVSAGKSFIDHLMVKDNYNAYMFAFDKTNLHTKLSPEFLKKINSLNKMNTGEIVNSALGTVDSASGNYRLVNAFSDALGYYSDPSKISSYTDEFCKSFNHEFEKIDNDKIKALKLSFLAHANLILIHPWMDGNKRTSRVLMHFLQHREHIPLTIIGLENQKDYLSGLKEYKYEQNTDYLLQVMGEIHKSTLQNEILLHKQRLDADINPGKRLNKGLNLF